MNTHTVPQLATLVSLSVVVAACGSYRGTHVYEVPEGFVGQVSITYGVDGCPPLPIEDGLAVRRVPSSGILCTSTPLREGWGFNHYYDVGNGRVAIPITGAPTDRRIWSLMSGKSWSGGETHRTEDFFVGTWQQHEVSRSTEPGTTE